jgi:hypothetical protein
MSNNLLIAWSRFFGIHPVDLTVQSAWLDDPTTFEYTSFVEQKAKDACRLLYRYRRVVSQFVHTNIRAHTELAIELNGRALDGNAAVEQYECSKVEQMNIIDGTTEFGAEAAQVVLLRQVGKVHNGWKFMVPPVEVLLNSIDGVGCQMWEGHVDVRDVALENGDLDHFDLNHVLKISTSRAFHDIEIPFTWYFPVIMRQVAYGGRDPSTKEDESAPGSLSAPPSFVAQGGRTADSVNLETSAQTDTELDVYQSHSRATHNVVHRNECAEG